MPIGSSAAVERCLPSARERTDRRFHDGCSTSVPLRRLVTHR